jgi:hypothetical protein
MAARVFESGSRAKFIRVVPDIEILFIPAATLEIVYRAVVKMLCPQFSVLTTSEPPAAAIFIFYITPLL